MNDEIQVNPSNTVEGDFDKVQGLDSDDLIGWGDYPLDSVFVRKEQRTVSEVVKRIKSDRYILNPDFQRDFVWPLQKQSKLIESCLMRIPLPVFYLAEAKDGRIIVVDGLQRLMTFSRYLENEFPLSKQSEVGVGQKRQNELAGKRFDDLPLKLQEYIEDTQLILYILDSKAPTRAKLDIFERVNSGEPLSRQQMRNSLYNGPGTKWLRKAALSQEFKEATDDRLNKKTMRDREAINRFCAFKILSLDDYNSDMDGFLAKSLEKLNLYSPEDFDQLTEEFSRSMRTNYNLFNRHSFRKSLVYNDVGVDRSVINISLFDVLSVLFANIEENIVDRYKDQLRIEIINLLLTTDFIHSITYSTNSRKQVKDRFDLMEKVIKKTIHND